MNLALTSDFPATTNADVLACIQVTSPTPRVAWIPPTTATGRVRFAAARATFQALGVPGLEYCDIDQEVDESQLARLEGYDVVYLTGGDPVAFQRNLARRGLAERLRACLADGRLLVAASGGAMNLTRNVSLFRLVSCTMDDVVGAHADYEGLSMVDYEILPHLNRCAPSFLDQVRRYSQWLPHDVVALEDGAAMIHAGAGQPRCSGRALRFRRGVESPIGTAA